MHGHPASLLSRVMLWRQLLLVVAAAAWLCSSTSPACAVVLHPAAGRGLDVNQRVRSQWRELQAICPSRTFISCKDVDRSTWTAADKTTVHNIAFNGIGVWSSFQIQTYDSTGKAQTSGGDSWVVVLRDPIQRISYATRVFDEADGTYTVALVFLRPGNYTAIARLYYSRCMAMQEPTTLPAGMTSQNLSKPDHCHIGTKVVLPTSFFVPSLAAEPQLGTGSCSLQQQRRRQLLRRRRRDRERDEDGIDGENPDQPFPFPNPDSMIWNTDQYYYKQGNTLITDTCFRPELPKRLFSTQRLFMYGDSTVRDAWWVLLGRAREKPCRVTLSPDLVRDAAVLNRGKNGNFFNTTFCPPIASWVDADPEMDAVMRRCTGGMPWTTVPVGTNFVGIQQAYPKSILINTIFKYKYDPQFEVNLDPALPRPTNARRFSVIYLDHHACRDHEHVLRDLRLVGLKPTDAVVMNMGGWCYPVLGFKEWASRIDRLAEGIGQLIAHRGPMWIWRSSMVLQEHVFRTKKNVFNGYLAGGVHFMTDMRRMEFESYAQDRLSRVGVHIWDVHAISQLGLNKEQDMIHASHPTHWAMNKDLLDTFVCPAN